MLRAATGDTYSLYVKVNGKFRAAALIPSAVLRSCLFPQSIWKGYPKLMSPLRESELCLKNETFLR